MYIFHPWNGVDQIVRHGISKRRSDATWRNYTCTNFLFRFALNAIHDQKTNLYDWLVCISEGLRVGNYLFIYNDHDKSSTTACVGKNSWLDLIKIGCYPSSCKLRGWFRKIPMQFCFKTKVISLIKLFNFSCMKALIIPLMFIYHWATCALFI